MKIYYLIEDGKVTNVLEPVQSGSTEENKLLEFLADRCDDRTNYGVFSGFDGKDHYFMKKICLKYLEYLKKYDI